MPRQGRGEGRGKDGRASDSNHSILKVVNLLEDNKENGQCKFLEGGNRLEGMRPAQFGNHFFKE